MRRFRRLAGGDVVVVVVAAASGVVLAPFYARRAQFTTPTVVVGIGIPAVSCTYTFLQCKLVVLVLFSLGDGVAGKENFIAEL